MVEQAMESVALAVSMRNPDPLEPKADRAAAFFAMEPADVPTLPPRQTLALGNCGPLIRPGAMDEAYTALGRIRADLQDTNRCLARERLGLVSGWLQAGSATKSALGRDETATAESKKEATDTKAARDVALAEASSTTERCGKA